MNKLVFSVTTEAGTFWLDCPSPKWCWSKNKSNHKWVKVKEAK